MDRRSFLRAALASGAMGGVYALGLPAADAEINDPVRAKLVSRLAKRGITVPNSDGFPTRVPVQITGTGRSRMAFVAGRVLVPVADLGRALNVLGPDVVGLESDSRVAELILGSGVSVLGSVDRLRAASPPILGAPNHLLFSAPGEVWRVREGEDPEPAPRPIGPNASTAPVGGKVVVSVIDNGIAARLLVDPWLTGIKPATRDLDPLNTYESSFGRPYLDTAAGHGTMVAGIIRQVAVKSDVRIVRALDTDGVGTDRQIAAGIARAINQLKDPMHVINLSVGGYTYGNRPPPAIAAALAQLSQNAIVVAAAGNEDWDRPSWPAAFPGVIGVGAIGALGATSNNAPYLKKPATTSRAAYSNYGKYVDVSAPGTWISTLCYGKENPLIETDGKPDTFSGFARGAGTSYACAAVSGAIAANASKLGSVREAADLVIKQLNAWRG